MPLDVNRRIVDGVTILDLEGRLVVGEEAKSARHSLAEAAAAEGKNLIINLQKVNYIDSTGLGTLVLGHSVMQQAGGAMKLLHLSKRHMELMVLSKLSTVFEMFDDEQLAINSFYPDRDAKPFDILEFVKSHENDKMRLGSESADPSEPSEA